MRLSQAALDVLSQASLAAKGEIDFFALVLDAGFVVGLVLVSLIFLSVASWGIIIYKYAQIRRAEKQSVGFLRIFWESRRLDQIYESCGELEISPIAQMFKAGYSELSKVRRREQNGNAENVFAELGELESIERALTRTATSQTTILEQLIPFLATTASAAPFIGLFGTVWGIMESFHDIGQVGNATLATVAPGISEALVATATGLAAAIPAVIGYNYFLQKIRVLGAEMDNFSSDFLNIVKRHFF